MLPISVYRASFVSTPLHGRRHPRQQPRQQPRPAAARTHEHGSVAKRKPQYVVDPSTQSLVEVHRRPTIEATTKPVLRPPPGATPVRNRGIRNRNNSPHASSNSSHSSSRTQDPLDKLEGVPIRPRTQEDLEEWMSWRIKVNEQLASYVLKDVSDLQENIPMGAFPKTMTNESLSAILHHAFHEEEQKSSLDKLSYMIYGIPRVSRDSIHSSEPDVEKGQEEQPKWPLSTKKLRRIPLEEPDMASSVTPSTPSIGTYDTAYSIIDRSSSPALTGGWDHNSDYMSQSYMRVPEPEPDFDDSPRSLSPHNFASSPPRGSSQTSRSITPVAGVGRGNRPPVAGAVPTVLSGLSIHQIPKLRPTQPRSPKSAGVHSDLPMFTRPQAAVPNPALLGKQRPPVDPLLRELAKVRLNPTPPKQNPIFEDNSPPRVSGGGEWAPFKSHALKPVKPATLPRPSTSPQLERKHTLRPVATLPREIHTSAAQPDFLDCQLKPVQRPQAPSTGVSSLHISPTGPQIPQTRTQPDFTGHQLKPVQRPPSLRIGSLPTSPPGPRMPLTRTQPDLSDYQKPVQRPPSQGFGSLPISPPGPGQPLSATQPDFLDGQLKPAQRPPSPSVGSFRISPPGPRQLPVASQPDVLDYQLKPGQRPPSPGVSSLTISSPGTRQPPNAPQRDFLDYQLKSVQRPPEPPGTGYLPSISQDPRQPPTALDTGGFVLPRAHIPTPPPPPPLPVAITGQGGCLPRTFPKNCS